MDLNSSRPDATVSGQSPFSATSGSATIPATLPDYIAIARPDNWVKNVFMVPGMLFALIVYNTPLDLTLFVRILVGIASTCLIASANYVINEYLDADFDRFHPLKKKRTSVVRVVNPVLVYAEYALLAAVGLSMAYFISTQFLIISAFLLFMGFIYNVKPFRSKDRVYLDVLSESVNNPIRFALGWFIFTPVMVLPESAWDMGWLAFPPSSIIVAYWMGGAFLMATKRFAEYRLIGDPELAGLYRRSFKFYTENSLLISMFFYALTSAFFLGIFLVKNRIELLISFPFFALLFSWYLRIGLLKDSPVQGSEKLYTRKYFMLYVVFFAALLVVLMFVDIPWLKWFLRHTSFH
jgi:4-hydroxybenzoate polyprenyltransferase